MSKQWWKSKTIWANVFMAGGTVLWNAVVANVDPQIVAIGASVINILLRKSTSGPIH